MPRIGELLLEHGWVDEANLRRALSEQALTGGRRICSLLIARGLLDPDHAARALGEQHEVAAVLQRHLEHRDLALVELLPAAIARNLIALPIGRTRTGELIVCVRDPSHEVEASLKRALDCPLVIAVAPAAQLEQLIEQSYEGDAASEFDVDLSTGTQIEAPGGGLFPADPMPETFSLVGLDDARVTKDPTPAFSTQRDTLTPFGTLTPPFGTTPAGSTTPPPIARNSPFSSITPPFATATPPGPIPVLDRPPALELDPDDDPPVEDTPPPPPPALPPLPSPALGTQPPRSQSKVMIPPMGTPLPRGPIKKSTTPHPLVQLTIEEVVAAIADAISRDTATDVAMRYASQRWSASLLLAVKDGAALGHRGHGTNLSPDVVRAVSIPLSSPSIVRSAHENRALVTEAPSKVGAINERLLRLLGSPTQPMAAPIIVAGRIACLITVGDPVGSGDGANDLGKLADTLGEAYTRILRDMK